MADKKRRSSRPPLSARARKVVSALEEMRDLEAPIRSFTMREVYKRQTGGRVSQASSARLIRRWRCLAESADDPSIADLWEMEAMAIVLIKRGLLPVIS